MTTDRELQRLLDRWLEDGPIEVADRVIDDVAVRIDRVRQRPAWRASRRFDPMTNPLKLAVAAAVVVAVGLTTFYFVRPADSPGVGGQPTSPPSPRPTPTLSPSPFPCDTAECAGALTVGDHRSAAFEPTVAFAVADADWVNPVDHAALYQLDSSAGYILIWGKPAIVERTAACEETPAVGRGTAPSDWIEYVTNHPGIEATNVRPVVVGGHSGQSADLTTLTTWTPPCAEDDLFPNLVQFIVNSVPSPAGIYGVTHEVPIRLIALDVMDQTVLVTYYGNDGRFPESVIRAQGVIDSMRFCFTPIGGGCTDSPGSSPAP